MEQLIKIHHHKGQKIVSARELHAFLGSKQQFTNWIKNRIEQYGFIEGEDFTSFNKLIKRGKGGTVRIEYALTMDMAKELGMIENNEKGRQIRVYFIRVEKGVQALLMPSYKINDEIERAKRWIEEKELHRKEIEKKDLLIEANAPKAAFADSVACSDNCILIREFAKLLTERGFEIGQNRLYQWLRDNKYLMRNNEPYQRYIAMGLFERKPWAVDSPKGTFTKYITKLTGKGQVYFATKIINNAPPNI